jgi:imidazolonepropionase-like amidohydrolase
MAGPQRERRGESAVPDAVRRIGPEAIRIEVGRLLDGTDAAPIDRGAILVEGDRIVAVGPASAVPAPDHARRYAFPGATALPGLTDAHVHTTFSGDLDPIGAMAKETDDQLIARGLVNTERLVRSGVTTAFDCGGRNQTTFRIRDALGRGAAVGPRLLCSGRPVTRKRGHCHWLNGEVVGPGPAGIRETVRRLIEDEGADGIKAMATGGGMTAGTDARWAAFTVEELEAAADEAHRHGRIITTHAHGTPGIRNATLAGIDGIQHVTMMGADRTWQFDPEVAALMKQHGTVGCPTMGSGTRADYESGLNLFDFQANPWAITKQQTIQNGRQLHEAGVTLVTATDVGVPLTDFGEEIFFELEIYASILGPAGAIRASTWDAAKYLGLENVTGTLRPGLVADVLVVDGRPDEDITALRRGRLVLAQGDVIQPTPTAPAPAKWLETLGLGRPTPEGAAAR